MSIATKRELVKVEQENQREEVQIPDVVLANVATGLAVLLILRRLKKIHNTLGLLTAMTSANNFQLQELEQSSIDARTLLELLGNTKGPE